MRDSTSNKNSQSQIIVYK